MKGRLSIGKVTCCGRPEEDYISIEVEDELSSIGFISVKVDIVTFTKALFGLGNVPVEFELQGLDKVGKKYEYKTVDVSIPTAPDGFSLTDENINYAVGEHEVDGGWVGSRRDCRNHHNHIRSDKTHQVYKVHYCRWVDVEEE